MSFNIVDLVKDQISDQLMGTLGNALGTQGAQTSNAVSGALPGLLGGLMNSASSPAGAGALFDSIQKQDDGMLGNMGALLGGNNASQVAEQGSSVLTSLLGGGALGKLAGVVSSFAGISRGNSSSMLGMLAPIVLGVLKKKVFDGGLNAGSLATMLSGQKDNINAAMPQGFSDQLQSSGFLDSIATAQPVASSNASVSSNTVSAPQPTSSGGGIFKWLLPLIAIAVLAWAAMQFFGGNKAEDAVNATQDAVSGAADQAGAASAEALKAAQDAMPDGIDLGEISNNLDGVFTSAKDSLGGITDLDSAREALPGLEEATGKLSGLNDVITRLPDAAQGPIGSIVSNGISALQPLVDKVTAIPGVGDIVGPVIKPLMDMLAGLAG